jgi:predicted dehydrogenase
MEKLGVGIIGFGRVGHGHVRAAQNVPEVRLVAIAEVDEQRRRLAAEIGCCETVADYRALLDRPDVHIVMIGLPHWLHARVAIDAAQAGKHIFVEKPMAMEVDECDRMIEAARRHNVKLMVGHSQHYNPYNRLAKQLIDGGELGELVYMTLHWTKPLGLESRPAWGMDRSKGGGMLQMNGAHMIDVMRWFAGQPIVAVKGRAGNFIFGDKVKADDSFIALLQFANGLQATIQHAAYLNGVEHYQHDVVGTRAMLKVASYPPQQGCWISHKGAWVPLEPPRQQRVGMAGELSDLVQSIVSGSEPPITGEYGREIVAAMSAIEESTRTGAEIQLGAVAAGAGSRVPGASHGLV